jgi:hypothetical protein
MRMMVLRARRHPVRNRLAAGGNRIRIAAASPAHHYT